MLTTIPPPIESDQETALILHPELSRLRQVTVNPPNAVAIRREFDLIDSLSRRWQIALALFLLCACLGTLLISKLIRPEFESEALIFLAPDLVQDKKGEIIQSPYHILVNQQVITILHDDTLSEAIRQLESKHVQWRAKGESELQAIGRLRQALDVHAVPDSYEIGVRATSSDPVKAAAIANAVAETFVDRANRLGSIGDGDNIAALNAEKEALNQQLQALLDVRGRLATSLQVINFGDGSQIPQDQALSRARQALADIHYKRLEAEANLAKNNLARGDSLADSAPQGPATTSLLQRRAELRGRIEDMLPSHPVRKQIEAELVDIDRELGLASDKPGAGTPESKRRLAAQVQAYQQIEERLSSDISKQSTSISSQAKSIEQAQSVSAEIQRLQNRLSQVEERSDDIKLRKVSGAVRVFAAGTSADAPKKTHKPKMLIFVWLASALLAAIVPVALDHLDPRVYRASEVELALEKPVIGQILRSSPKLDAFAQEQLARSVASLARLIKESPAAKSVFVSGLKQRCDATLLRTIATGLRKYNISARVCSEMELLDRTDRAQSSSGQSSSAESTVALEGRTIVLFNGPPLLFSAEAERLAGEAEILLITVQSGLDLHANLSHCARILERLKPSEVAVLVNDVQPERAGRQLKAEIKSYLAASRAFS